MNEVICLASWNADLVSRVARPLARGETLMASGFTIGPGGKGSNAAVACARQGAQVAVIARIGRDDFGRVALDLWAREGIDASMVDSSMTSRAASRRSSSMAMATTASRWPRVRAPDSVRAMPMPRRCHCARMRWSWRRATCRSRPPARHSAMPAAVAASPC